MKKSLCLLSAGFVAAMGLVSCGGGESGPSTFAITFHQTVEGPNEDKVVTVEIGKTTLEDVWDQEPEINPIAGYTAAWDDYTITGVTEDFTIEPTYTPIEFTATCINRVSGETLGTVTFTVLDTELALPDLPTEVGYTYAWETYAIEAKDMNVYCNRTANMHTAKFFEDAAKTIQVGETLNFTIETESLNEPDVPTHEGYDGKWADYDLTGDVDLEIVAEYELHLFYLQFSADGEAVGEPVGYNVLDTYADIDKPEIPAKTGYVGAWPSTITLERKELEEAQVVEATYTPKTYEVTLLDAGGSLVSKETVTYDAPYSLPSAGIGLAWYNEDEKFASEGTWTLDENITLRAKSVYLNIDFTNVDDLDVLVSKDKAATSSIVDDDVQGKAAQYVSATWYTRLDLRADVLSSIFADPSVKEIRFDAMGLKNNNDFRHMTQGTKVCYELNKTGWGISTEWKTFAYTREMYEAKLANEGDYFLDFSSLSTGDVLKIANIRAAYENMQDLGFDGGSLAAPIQDSHGDYSFPYKARMKDEVIFKALCAPTVYETVTNYGFSSSIKSEGLRSYSITKGNGYMAFFLPTIRSKLQEGDTISFDLYSTVYAGFAVGNMVDGMNNKTFEGEGHPANRWVTYTIDTTQMTADGRFLIIQGSTAGSFYFDNIRINRAAE